MSTQPAGGVEAGDAVALRVADAVAEQRAAAVPVDLGDRVGEQPAHAVAEEDVVAEHQGGGVVAEVLGADEERLRQPVRRRLHGVAELDAPLRPVAEQPDELLLVVRRGDDQDVPDPGQHQRRDRVVDHRLVVDRQQLLADAAGERVQPGARTTRQDDALHRPNPRARRPAGDAGEITDRSRRTSPRPRSCPAPTSAGACRTTRWCGPVRYAGRRSAGASRARRAASRRRWRSAGRARPGR